MTAPIHIRARPEDVAPIVLLPGDPGRATRVAERLDGRRCYNEFRGLLGYTGSYKGTPVSVQTTGMGAPSAAIVVEELALLGARPSSALAPAAAPSRKSGPRTSSSPPAPIHSTALPASIWGTTPILPKPPIASCGR